MDALFGIRYGDVMLDVADGSRLTVEWMSVLFNEEQLFAGSYSYPIVFPLTPRNRAAFGNAHLPENRLARRKLGVVVQLFGQSWKRAVLAFDVTAEGYEGDLQIDSGTVAEWMRERSLASVFTISNNGKFVKHIPVKVSSDGFGRVETILDSINNPGKYPWVFFPLKNEMRAGLDPMDPPGSEVSFVNEWQSGFFRGDGGGLFTPFFYLTWVITEVCKWLGFEARGSFLTHREVRTWVIYNTGMIGGEEFNAPAMELYPARHLPGMSVAAFMKAIRNDMKVAIYFDSHERVAYFDLPDDVLGRTDGVDIAASVDVGILKIKRNGAEGFDLKTLVDDGDECYKLFPYVRNYTVGLSDTPKPQDLQTGTLFMYHGPMHLNPSAHHRMPWARQLANIYDDAYSETEAYNALNTYGRNDFKLRLIAYRGMVPWGSAGTSGMIPYGTCDNLDEHGDPAYDFSVQPGGEHGWLTRFTLNWYEMLCSTEPVDMMARLTAVDFFRLAPLRKILFAGDSRARIAALPDRITFEPTERGRVVACRILAYPHYNMGGMATESVVFYEGEVVVPEITIYARLKMENERYTLNKSKEKRKVADIMVYFFRDSAETIPYEASNLPMRIVEHYRDENNTNLYFYHPVQASGMVFFAGTGTIHYWKKGTIWNMWNGDDVYYDYYIDPPADNSFQIL